MHYFYTLFLCIIYVNFQTLNRHLLFKKIFLYKFFEISFFEKILFVIFKNIVVFILFFSKKISRFFKNFHEI